MSVSVSKLPGLIAFWDFQEQAGCERISKGPGEYRLKEMGESVERAADGFFGEYSAIMGEGKWFSISKKDGPKLDFHGNNTTFTVAAWIKRSWKEQKECQAIAGIWNETLLLRQYCLFIDLTIWDSDNQVCGHLSATGGPTPGCPHCMEAAIGNTVVTMDEWHLLAFTYDGHFARVYLDGKLDEREQLNPYEYPYAIFDGGELADFTVGAVSRHGEMGNWYCGLLGGLAIYDRALDEDEIALMPCTNIIN